MIWACFCELKDEFVDMNDDDDDGSQAEAAKAARKAGWMDISAVGSGWRMGKYIYITTLWYGEIYITTL